MYVQTSQGYVPCAEWCAFAYHTNDSEPCKLLELMFCLGLDGPDLNQNEHTWDVIGGVLRRRGPVLFQQLVMDA